MASQETTTSASLFYRATGPLIGRIAVDLIVSEQHSVKVTVTDRPIEDGSTIADHARVEPRRGNLTAFVSNHPLYEFVPAIPNQVQQKINSFQRLTADDFAALPVRANRAKDTWERLKELAIAKTVLLIVTSLDDYENVMIEDLSTELDADSGDALRIKLQFKQVRTVQLKDVVLGYSLGGTFPKATAAQQKVLPAKNYGTTGGKPVYDKLSKGPLWATLSP